MCDKDVESSKANTGYSPVGGQYTNSAREMTLKEKLIYKYERLTKEKNAVEESLNLIAECPDIEKYERFKTLMERINL